MKNTRQNLGIYSNYQMVRGLSREKLNIFALLFHAGAHYLVHIVVADKESALLYYYRSTTLGGYEIARRNRENIGWLNRMNYYGRVACKGTSDVPAVPRASGKTKHGEHNRRQQ